MSRRLILTALLALLASPAAAQMEYLSVAPLQIGVDSWLAPDPGQLGFSVTAQRTVPLYFFLPNVSEDSRFDLLTLKGGVRSANRDTRPAYAFRVLDAFVAKAPWAGGLTLLSYDRAGPFRLQADWLALRAGPVMRTGRLEVRALARASFSTVGATGGLFVGPSDANTGLDASLTFNLIGRWGRDAIIGADASAARLLAGSNPERLSWQGYVHIKPEGVLSLRAGLGQVVLESDNFLRSSEWLGRVAVIVTPQRRDF